MYDAAYPPGHPPRWPVVAGYLGGDTPHVWHLAEWEHQPARYRLPIWVRSNPGAVNVAHDAAACLTAAHAVGVPHGATVALDFESAVNADYVRGFERVLLADGYGTLLYGSASTVRRNPQPNRGYWAAHWTGAAHMEPDAAATQYTNGAAYDASLISSRVPLWDSHAGHAAPPAAPATHSVFVPVTAGQSWSSIAGEYGHTWQDLWTWNLTPGVRPPGTQEVLKSRGPEDSLRVGSTVAIPTTWKKVHK